MTHYRACNLCEAICGLVIETEDNHVVSIRGDRDDPFSQGYLCPKALALQDVNEDPERLRQPLRRTATGWETIDWDTAIATVVDRLADIQDAHGRDAVAVYRGNPSVHNSGTILTASAFGKALGSRRNYSATSVDQLPHHYAAFLQFGHQLLLPVPDIDRTDFLLILGGNPLVSNGSIMTAPNVRGRLRAIGERGGRVVVVDPARTRTAELADTHLAPLPGTDVFLLLALVKIVLTEGLADLGHLSGCTDGIAELTDFVRPFQLPELAAACDLPETEIRELAHAFAAAPSAVAYGRMGVSTQQYGGYCQWLVNVLNAITGNLDRPGGAMFTTPAVDVLKQVSRGHVGRQRSKVRQLPSFGGELPVATLGEDILARDGERDIRALVTVAGNPIVSTPNAGQLERAIESLDFVVAIDIYLNETTRHADIILPPTTGLETDHYDLVFNLLAVRNVAKYSPATLAPGPDTRHDHEIFNALTSGLHARRGTDSWMKKLQRWVSPERQLDLGLRLGPHSLTVGATEAGAARRRPRPPAALPARPPLHRRQAHATDAPCLCHRPGGPPRGEPASGTRPAGRSLFAHRPAGAADQQFLAPPESAAPKE